jgi:peptidoglycan hydrolase CwlO-like protein
MAGKRYISLGTVVKIEPSGMVLLSDGNRSSTKAEVGDSLKKDTETGDIIVTKAKESKTNNQDNEVAALNKEVETLQSTLKTKDDELNTLKTKNEELEQLIKTKDDELKTLKAESKTSPSSLLGDISDDKKVGGK